MKLIREHEFTLGLFSITHYINSVNNARVSNVINGLLNESCGVTFWRRGLFALTLEKDLTSYGNSC